MMTRKFSHFFICIFFIFSVFTMPLAAAQNQTEWVVAAQKFDFTRNQTGAVADGIATMFPARILEKLSSNLYRTVNIDESAERELYKIKMERNSLFLQLSSRVKTRDSLVLGNYSQRELELKIEQENNKIKEIKNSLDQNLARQKELGGIIESINNEDELLLQAKNSKSDIGTKTFFKSLFFSQDSLEQEKIVLYRNDISALFIPNQNSDVEKQLVDSKINCLITGQITAFDEYMSVTVTAKVYPGAKEIVVMTEIGSVDDADLMASVFATQLAPAITNSMPCEILITTDTYEALNSLCVYIDDVLYSDFSTDFTIDSGVHFIQFTAEGFKNAGTSYYFEGNKKYTINVSLEKIQKNTVYLRPKSILEGQFVVNGIPAKKLEDDASKITINGNAVLAQFITEEKDSFFMYIPENKISEGALYTAKVKPVNHSEFIEKRRKEMYLSYSILVTSLMPTIITKGIVESYKPMLADKEKQKGLDNLDEKLKTANGYVLASNICTGISIACGVWFVFELYRYFSAANSVLPATTKIDFNYEPAKEVMEIVTEETPQESDKTNEEGDIP